MNMRIASPMMLSIVSTSKRALSMNVLALGEVQTFGKTVDDSAKRLNSYLSLPHLEF